MPTIGLLYPGHSAEDDYPALEVRLDSDLRLPLVHTSVGEDAHRVDALLDLGGAARLAEGARALVEAHSPDSVMWACTSGSFVFGWDGAHEQVAQLQEVTGLPTSSTSLAFVAACRALGLTRVSVAASYPQDVAEHFVAFLGAGGIEVTAMGSHGIVTAAEVGTLGEPEVEAIVRGADLSGGAQAVLVPDTAMHTLQWISSLERAAGVPVLTANQVTIWQGLNLLGEVPEIQDLGTLFTRSGD
ncbi:maleate cis-trans isomerase [Ornithinimicrobium sp. F0845]|uniref:maleate cis-trans isomerase family protein n=1 Tax=Ornithinimicrobium sp. F0845 TaxID=2926412 RepID=UPI001FF480F2|nr:maleate cis-trans isomerase [Ornithinimicrobium sp. F0845]MCK0111522.1 maleate cis-trans isomerase [Ornithinimicrobium sp. F0845]